GAERQPAVRGGHRVLVEALARGCLAAVEAAAVVARLAAEGAPAAALDLLRPLGRRLLRGAAAAARDRQRQRAEEDDRAHHLGHPAPMRLPAASSAALRSSCPVGPSPSVSRKASPCPGPVTSRK